MALLLLVFLLFAGCSTQHYRKSADNEAYGVITQKTPLVKNMDQHFSIEQTNGVSLEGLPLVTTVGEFLGADGEKERNAHIISLEQALDMAVNHSRNYQFQKEQLFLAALSLTLARHQFAPIFAAGGAATYTVNTADVIDYIPDPNDPSGQRQIPILSPNLAETRTAD